MDDYDDLRDAINMLTDMSVTRSEAAQAAYNRLPDQYPSSKADQFEAFHYLNDEVDQINVHWVLRGTVH